MTTEELLRSIRFFYQWDTAGTAMLYNHGGIRPFDIEKYEKLVKWRNEEAAKINDHFGEVVFGII